MSSLLKSAFEGGVSTLTIQAQRLDAASAPKFRSDCEAIWPRPVNELIADIREVDFVDSSGVAALLSLYRRVATGSPNVALVGLKPKVLTVIELLRLHRIFRVAP